MFGKIPSSSLGLNDDHHRNSDIPDLVRKFGGLDTMQSDVEKDVLLTKLESYLSLHDVVPATADDISRIMNDTKLLCRSEAFSSALHLLTLQEPLEIQNEGKQANVCSMRTSGEGFRAALEEGFSGKEVNDLVKTVLTFAPGEGFHTSSVPGSDSLWENKSETAEISKVGQGVILPSEVRLVSFRFPTRLVPHDFFTESELEKMEEKDIPHIVRHFIPRNTPPENKKDAH